MPKSVAGPPVPELIRLAFARLQESDWVATQQLARQVLAQQPDHPAALNALAIALNAQARHREAAEGFQRLTRIEPAVPAHWMNLGTALRADRRFDDAIRAYARAAQLGEASADFFYNVGLLHVDRADFPAALAALTRARALAPRDAEICVQYAQCCYECMQGDDAIAALDDWPGFTGLRSDLVARIGLIFINLGEPGRARQAVERAAADPQPDADTALRLAQVWERLNDVAAARAALNGISTPAARDRLGTDLIVAEAQIAQREDRHEEACRLFERALEQCPEPHLRHFHLFPLAKSLDALKRHADAFAALTAGHDSHVAHLRLTGSLAPVERTPIMNITRFGCDASDVAQWDHTGAPGCAASPVFVVAFPRSGTTLLEQTLDAHPQLVSMDEQPYLQNAVESLVAAGVQYPEQMRDAPQEQLEAARQRYWSLVGRRVQLQPGQRLVDKNPLNLLRLPAIRRLFPASPMILAIRHPCDVILSCFMQHFRAPEFVFMCRELGTLALGYRRALDFWYQQAALLAPTVMEVRYETFVADFAAEVRRIAQFLSVPWDDAMLSPGEHARARGFISTPSYAQVVKPVNSRSVGRWHPYEERFGPVLEQVSEYLERWGYEGERGSTAHGAS